jgi:uncharacterized protein YidB (DUF937 family)
MDDLSGLLSGLGAGSGGPGVAGADPMGGLAGALSQGGGLDGVVDQLRQAGLGGAVDSWIGTGSNQPVDPQALGAALGPDTVQQLSSGTGIDIASLLPMLAAFLPQIIDMLTPDGKVPDGGLNGAVANGGLPDLGGLLGGLMAGGGAGGGAGLDDLLGGLGGMLGGDKGR